MRAITSLPFSGAREHPSLVLFPPPASFCKLAQARLQRRNSSLFQRDLARPTEPQRLAGCRNAVSEPLSSLSERTSPDLVRSKKTQRFQSFADSCRPNFSPQFCRQAFNQRHPKWALCGAWMRGPAYAPAQVARQKGSAEQAVVDTGRETARRPLRESHGDLLSEAPPARLLFVGEVQFLPHPGQVVWLLAICRGPAVFGVLQPLQPFDHLRTPLLGLCRLTR